ncbi:MAG: hypothetical protein U0Q55_19385 [Vicinamibacterales bacterium]
MADRTLSDIDQAMSDATARRLARVRAPQPGRAATAPARPVQAAPRAEQGETYDHLDVIVTASLVLQFLSAAVLFAPGTQPLRTYVRAMPYIGALLPLGYYVTRHVRSWQPAGAGALIGALLLLTLNLLHPTSQMSAGIAQCIFQLAITAPMFWMSKAVRSTKQFQQMLVLVFLMNFVSAGLGVLQVYAPERFLPGQFSTQLREDYLGSLTYVGSDGRIITRPPGLSDVPGGAAVAGGVAAVLGLGLTFRATTPWQTAGALAAVLVGVAVVYLTQVRSVFLMIVAAAMVLTLITLKLGRLGRASWLMVGGGAVLVGSFLWATSLGGDVVNERFVGISQQGAVGVFQQNRGSFLSETLGDLLTKYPLGAGVGRWGMMNTTFGDPNAFRAAPIHVEIQLTGWLLDGGLPMWLLYGGAVLISIFAAFRLAESPDPVIADLALISVALQVFIAGLAMAGPIFNTQMGVLFWSCAAGLHGASLGLRAGKPDGRTSPHGSHS